MIDATLSLSILAAVVVLFVWNRFPVELVAVGAALALFFSGDQLTVRLVVRLFVMYVLIRLTPRMLPF